MQELKLEIYRDLEISQPPCHEFVNCYARGRDILLQAYSHRATGPITLYVEMDGIHRLFRFLAEG
jgi:hypothetical protein